MKKRIVNIAGKVLMVLALALVAWQLFKDPVDFSMLGSVPVVLALCLLFLLHGANIFAASQVYSRLLNVMAGKRVNRLTVVKRYCGSNLYRYIPGNVMHYIGRNQIAVDEDVAHSEVAFATLVEAIFLLLAALIISVISVFDYLVSYVSGMTFDPVILWVVGAAVVLVAALLILFRKKIGRFVRKYWAVIRRLRPATCLWVLGAAALRLFINAGIYLCVTLLMGQHITLALLPQLVGLFIMAWAIGFVTPGAPAGLGVREAIMLMFLSDVLDPNVLMTSTIIYRVICILGDFSALAYSGIYVALGKRRQRRAPPQNVPAGSPSQDTAPQQEKTG